MVVSGNRDKHLEDPNSVLSGDAAPFSLCCFADDSERLELKCLLADAQLGKVRKGTCSTESPGIGPIGFPFRLPGHGGGLHHFLALFGLNVFPSRLKGPRGRRAAGAGQIDAGGSTGRGEEGDGGRVAVQARLTQAAATGEVRRGLWSFCF